MTGPAGAGGGHSSRRQRDRAVDAELELAALAEQYVRALGLLDRSTLLRGLSQQVREAVGAELGFAGMREPNGAAVLRHLSGARTNQLFELAIPPGRGLGGKAMEQLQPQWVPDYEADTGITHHFDAIVRAEGMRAVLAVPLQFGSTLYGVAYAGLRSPASFSDLALGRVTGVAANASAGLHAAELADSRTEVALASERRRLAADLHDSLGAMLFSIGAQVHDLRDAYPEGGSLVDRLARIEAQVGQATEALRDSLAALHQAEPSQALPVTVAGDCRAFTERTGVPARSFALSELPPLDSARSAALVGTAREAMLNAEKHARASAVVVTLATLEGGVLLAVSDDGVGIDGELVDSNGGLGMLTSRERLERVGGRLSVVADEDGGTTVRAWVPYG